MQDENDQQENKNTKKRKGRRKTKSRIANIVGGSIVKQANKSLGRSIDIELQSNQEQVSEAGSPRRRPTMVMKDFTQAQIYKQSQSFDTNQSGQSNGKIMPSVSFEIEKNNIVKQDSLKVLNVKKKRV